MGSVPPVLDPLQQLVAFLDDGQVGGEVGVEHLVEPSRRRAAIILPVTSDPAGMPNSSPSAARMAGASWTTTCLVGILQRGPDLVDVVLLIEGARPGRPARTGRSMQLVSIRGMSNGGTDNDLVAPVGRLRTPAVWISSHTVTQR